MNRSNRPGQTQMVAMLVSRYHDKRLKAVKSITVRTLLKRINPYLLITNGVSTARELVEGFLDSHLMLSDASRWARLFFEPLFEHVSGAIPAGRRGVDYVRETVHVRCEFSLKSGPMVLNADQRQKQAEFFRESRHSWLSTGNQNGKVHRHILGCAYGSMNSEPSRARDFYTRSGQALWKEATGDKEFYVRLADQIGDAHYAHKLAFEEAKATVVARLVRDLMKGGFCSDHGRLIWRKIIEHNSGDRRVAKVEPAAAIRAGHDPAAGQSPAATLDSNQQKRERYLERKRRNNRAYRGRLRERRKRIETARTESTPSPEPNAMAVEAGCETLKSFVESNRASGVTWTGGVD